MMRPGEMKVGVPVRDADLDRKRRRPGKEQCSHRNCGVREGSPWYESGTVMVVRHWKTNSAGGTWFWYCEEHFAQYRPWKTDALAPAELLP
jgi:hypothetical protein